AGLQSDELLIIAAVERQRLNLVLIDDDAEVGSRRVDQRRRGGDVNRVADRAGFEREIDLRTRARIQFDFLTFGQLETLSRDLNRISPGRQQRELIIALGVRYGLAGHIGLNVRGFDRRVRQRRPALVLDRPDYGAAADLGVDGAGKRA